MIFKFSRRFLLSMLLSFISVAAQAQFSGSIQGTVQDPSGAFVPNASITLENAATHVITTLTSDSGGNYQFVTLGPGVYTVTVNAASFGISRVNVTLDARQTQNVPVILAPAGSSQVVQVTSQAPLLDTAETRNQLTLSTQEISELPLPGHNLISLVTYAPGVVGLGATGNQTTGSGPDNFAPENQVSASANGRGSVGNLYVIDNLDVTSYIRPGVLNIVPNGDSVQETTVQVNTYDVDYGRASSLEVILSTKAGGDKFHGRISDFYNSEKLTAGTEFVHHLAPFHGNDFSASIGGPLIPRRQAFFFFAYQTLRSTQSSTGTTTYEDPAFTTFARTSYANSSGTSFLAKFAPTAVTTTSVAKTAAQLFPTTCNTAATNFLPCSTAVIDNGNFNFANIRNGSQYNGRADKYFKKDRVYAGVYYTPLSTTTANIRPAFNNSSAYISRSIQLNEEHTFNPDFINEAAFGFVRIEGNAPQVGMFSIPVANITGQAAGFGVSGANTNYIQRNFHYRDNIFFTHRAHTIKGGFDGWKGYDIANFQGLNSQPVFAYNNLIDFVNDAPHQESGLSYNPLTGQPQLANTGYGSATYGAFIEDSWRARKNLVVNYGVRWDNFGNPYPLNGTGFANFYLGAGSTIQQQVANGNMVQTPHFFAHSISNVWSPRAGFSWDPTSNGRFIVKGGFGLYRDWPTLGISDTRLKANPPNYITPTFLAGTTTAPVLTVGTSNVFPYGFTYPSLPARSLDAHGGLPGLQIQVGGIDPAIKSTNSYIYSASVDAQLPLKLVGSIGYSGSHSDNLLTDSGAQTTVSWGDDVNRFDGDLIVNNNVLTRLNPSFGALYYIRNIARANYNAMLLSVRGRFNKHGFISASYTYSHSSDNSQIYPTPFNISQYYAPSVWDAPQRLSLLINYEIPGSHSDNHFLNLVTNGFSLSNTTILQSGTPFVVSTSASFQPTRSSAGVINGITAASGDYNADGRNYDFPNVSTYNYATDRGSYLGRTNATGIFAAGQFTQPSLGSEGTEIPYQFRNPGYADTDLGIRKNNSVHEGIGLEFRADIFNLFNRPNLGAVTSDLSSGSFGKSTSQINSRFIQLGVALNF